MNTDKRYDLVNKDGVPVYRDLPWPVASYVFNQLRKTDFVDGKLKLEETKDE